MKPARLALLACVTLPSTIQADTFGTNANTFTIDFVTIGNPGNGNDRAFDDTIQTPGNPTDDEYASPYGGVNYVYRMGKYEISQDQIAKATASGLQEVAGAY